MGKGFSFHHSMGGSCGNGIIESLRSCVSPWMTLNRCMSDYFQLDFGGQDSPYSLFNKNILKKKPHSTIFISIEFIQIFLRVFVKFFGKLILLALLLFVTSMWYHVIHLWCHQGSRFKKDLGRLILVSLQKHVTLLNIIHGKYANTNFCLVCQPAQEKVGRWGRSAKLGVSANGWLKRLLSWAPSQGLSNASLNMGAVP